MLLAISTMDLFYYTLNNQSVAEYKDKGSKFIAYAFPVLNKIDFKKKLQELKQLHLKANHLCYAFQTGFDNNIFIKSSDDGEPSGSAGKPILNQILSKQLCNVGIVVVRYFGGTLLGVGGLMNAYKNAASMALQIAFIEKKNREQKVQIECEHGEVHKIIEVLKNYQCTQLQQNLGLFCIIVCCIPFAFLEDFKTNMQTLNHKKWKVIFD